MTIGPVPSPKSPVLVNRLEQLLRRVASRRSVHHAIMAVYRGDDAFGWVGAAGRATAAGAPMHPDTPFFLASITKLYIAAAVLKLCERRLVALDEPIVRYLAHVELNGLHRLGGVDYTSTITVRNLLGHASGLPDYLEERPKGGRSLVEQLVAEGDRRWDLADVVRIVRDELTPHFPPQPADAPRWRARYSDSNYALLIGIVEAVTGEPWHRALENLLLRPLALRHSWHPSGRPLAPTREPAGLWDGARPLTIPLALESSNDLYATADDAVGLLRALIRGTAFDDPRTAHHMWRAWNRLGFHPWQPRLPGWPIRYGLGMMRFQLPRFVTQFYPLPAVVGHTGSTGTWLFHCPELDLFLAGAVSQVAAAALPFRVVPETLRLVLRAVRTRGIG